MGFEPASFADHLVPTRLLDRSESPGFHRAATGAVDEAEVDRVSISLYHAQLPRLVGIGILEIDHDDETITTAPHAEQALSILENTGASDAALLELHARRQPDD